jgi:hypothetical protein
MTRPRILLVLGVATAVTLAACTEATEPMLGMIPSATAGRGGGSGTGSATTLKVFPSSIQLPVGTTAQLSTNAPLSLLNQVQWVALQPTIASVSTSGTVGTLSPGVAVIVARYAFDTTQFATSTITVLGPSIPTVTGATAVVRP